MPTPLKRPHDMTLIGMARCKQRGFRSKRQHLTKLKTMGAISMGWVLYDNAGFEYFWQEEAKEGPLPVNGALRLMPPGRQAVEAPSRARTRVHGAREGRFSLHGHRLSSLYRAVEFDQVSLKNRNRASSCQKYSKPVASIGKVA